MNHGAGRPGDRGRTRVRVEPQAHSDLERREEAVADAVAEFVRRLRADRTNRALRLSPLRKAGDDANLCLAQPDPRCMVLVLVTDGGDEMRVLAVRDGTRARDELARLTVEINPVSGTVEVVDQTEADATVVSLRGRSTPLFAPYDDQTLIALGVVRSLLPALREITSDEQFRKLLTHNLPELTRDVLLALHEGVSAEEVRRHITDAWRADEEVDPRDWARAARRAVSRAETDDDAVLGALGRSFDAWRLFLHPEQRRLATGDFKGSAKVTGGPGTGKTVVALHRVRHLVDRLPPGHSRPVLLTTYNTNLALELTERLRQLGGDELLRRVDVRSVDALALAVVEESRGEVGRPLDDDAAMNLWHTVRYETDLLDYDADFLDAEFKHVILANRCGTWDAYRRVGRSGRPRISNAQRHDVWQLVQAYRAQLDGTPRRTTYALIADRAAELEQRRMSRIEEQARYKADEQRGRDLVHREAGSGMWLTPRYRHVVVDEAQDLAASHWRMLRAMVRKGPNDIFLAGDAHQRIYGSRVVLGHQGIEIRGRASRRLTLNYRTTRQILGSANRLIEGATFDDLDTGTDTLDGYRSVLTGLAPQFWRAPDRLTEMRAVATLIRERRELHGTAYSAMAVSVPDGGTAQEFANVLLREFGLPVVELGRRGVRSDEDAVRVGTMHRFKGLEFQRVFLTSVGEGQVPHQRIEQYRHTVPDRYRQEEQRARSLMFVAATRARDELIVTWSGRASRFLPSDADRTALRAVDLLGRDGPPSGSSGSAAA
ncbi:UvrD-helicase domain-containing protein [Streptomyces sp. NPDC053780]|uniref:UvrD-helicase domain-containing protein n=1 Tax=unclassified Streptomyces TaxID=2593676 RepID=UPI0034395EAC